MCVERRVMAPSFWLVDSMLFSGTRCFEILDEGEGVVFGSWLLSLPGNGCDAGLFGSGYVPAPFQFLGLRAASGGW